MHSPTPAESVTPTPPGLPDPPAPPPLGMLSIHRVVSQSLANNGTSLFRNASGQQLAAHYTVCGRPSAPPAPPPELGRRSLIARVENQLKSQEAFSDA
jgi:hypothetical protein